jgi:leucyl-tRNA synthetase
LSFDEPFKKLINQGKITGESRFVYRVNGLNMFMSKSWYDKLNKLDYHTDFDQLTNYAQTINQKIGRILFGSGGSISLLTADMMTSDYTTIGLFNLSELHVDISLVDGVELDTEAFKKWKPDFANAEFILEEDGKYICGTAIEKMSKSYFNVVNPDDIIETYGADTLRMYEMFLGPLEQSKPWNTNGIDGVYKFLRRFWNLLHDSTGKFKVSDAEPTREELKVLHKTLKKVEQDIENFSFNTSVSEFMICANELSSLKCNKRKIIEPLVIALSPFAPHMTEELWSLLGHPETILNASFPKFEEQYLIESSFSYPISINGKVRAHMEFALDVPKEEIEKTVLASEIVQKWTEGKPPKKVIVVPGKIVNVVM